MEISALSFNSGIGGPVCRIPVSDHPTNFGSRLDTLCAQAGVDSRKTSMARDALRPFLPCTIFAKITTRLYQPFRHVASRVVSIRYLRCGEASRGVGVRGRSWKTSLGGDLDLEDGAVGDMGITCSRTTCASSMASFLIDWICLLVSMHYGF